MRDKSYEIFFSANKPTIQKYNLMSYMNKLRLDNRKEFYSLC